MLKTKLVDCPEWLLKADTKNEDVEIQRGVVVWNSGDFLGGLFMDGMFMGGNFLGGNFWGNFWSGEFVGGNFSGGNFWSGDFLGGNFLYGDFHGGNFQGGNFFGGNFFGGEFLGGSVRNVPVQSIQTFAFCDGYSKTLVAVDGVAWILAGDHWFTLAEAHKHWDGNPDRVTTSAMLLGADRLAEIKGLRSS